jgi:hypothetical protein
VPSTTQKGDTAETAILASLTEFGHVVSVPFAGAASYDLVADLEGELVRVQVKHGRITGDHVEVSLRRTNPNHNEYVESYYRADEIDTYAIYAPEIDRSFWLPFEEAPGSSLRIRYRGQPDIDHPSIRWADDYALSARLS